MCIFFNISVERILKMEDYKKSIDMIREENKRNREREKFLHKIESNPDLINNWSNERLMKLNAIYDERISQYNREIERLKNRRKDEN